MIKGSIITIFFLITGFSGMSQATAIKMQLHYWNKPEQNFEKTLTKNGKILLDSLLSYSKIDTSKCIKVDRKEIIELTSTKFLANHSYTYLTYENYNGEVNKNYYRNFNGFHKQGTCKVILYHSTDRKTIDVVTMYVIE